MTWAKSARMLTIYKTLRFVQSLPKRERQPLSNKFKNADPLGKPSVLCFPARH